MPTEGREKGVRTPYSVRFGISPPSYFGTNRQKPTYMLTDSQGPDAVNVRIVGGRPVSRPGQQKVNADALEPIHGFHDATSEVIAATNDIAESSDGFIYFVVSAGGESSFCSYDTVNHVFTADTFDPAATPYYGYAQIILGSDGTIYAGSYKMSDPGGSATFIGTAVHSITPAPFAKALVWEVATAVGGGFSSGGIDYNLAEHPTAALKFVRGFTWADGGPETGKVYYDAGLDDTFSPDFTAAAQKVGPNFVAFNGTVYALWGLLVTSYTAATIRKRVSAGTWVNLTMPTPPVAHFCPAAGQPGIVYGGKLFVTGSYATVAGVNSCHFLSVDTADVVAAEHSITNYFPALVTIFDGNLCYFYKDSFGIARLGYYDGVTWTDGVWSGTITTHEYIPIATGTLGGNLYLLALKDSVAIALLRSNGTDLATWTDLGGPGVGQFGYSGHIVTIPNP